MHNKLRQGDEDLKKLVAAATGLLLLMVALPAAAEPLSLPVSASLTLDLQLETVPDLGTWDRPQAAAADGAWTASTDAGYVLTATPADDGTVGIRLERTGGRAFKVSDFRALVRVPLKGLAAVWDTQIPPFESLFRRVPEVDYKLETRAQVGIPVVTLVDAYGNNLLTAGFVEQGDTCELEGARDGYDYALSMRRLTGDAEKPAASFEIDLYLSQQPHYWFEAVQQYTAAVDAATGYTPRPTPQIAYEPQYSTRYPFEDKITQDIVLNNALLAKELGAKQILIDVGWSTNQGWADSSGDYGDYTPASSKFSDFKGLVDRLHSEGLKVTLWVAPTWIGRQAKSFEEIQDYRVKFPGGDYDRNLCPRTPEARAFIAGKLAGLVKEYGVDGFWFDFVDTFLSTCEAPHEHDIDDFGDAVAQMAEDVYVAVTRENPQAILEYRVPYANLHFKPHANVFETTWSPEDFVSNRMMGTFLRAYSDGILTKTDPVFWGKTEDHEDVGRYMMTSLMIGPVAFSGDLENMSEGWREQIRQWVAYYQANRHDLLEGEFTPFGAAWHVPDLKIVGDDKAFVYLSSKASKVIRIDKPVEELHILNSNPPTQGQLRFTVEGLPDGDYSGKYFDCHMSSHRDEPFVSKGGRMVVSTDMPTGGVLVLTRK